MTRDNLIKIISKESGLKAKKSAKIFNRVFDLISKEIKRGGNVSIENFGEFRIKRQELKIRNNKNKTRVIVPPKEVIEFEFTANIN